MPRTYDSRPRILVFDSGLGGLTVYAEIQRARPDANLIYAADDAAFPYGAMSEAALVARVMKVLGGLIGAHRPDVAVIACNTASTLVLAPLRARYPNLPFVGAVPAIKPAALASRSKLISVLATPGTVARDYTRALVRDYAGDCEVALVGAPNLASLAEDYLRLARLDDAAIAAEIAPAFVARSGRRTDVIVLACTHYPLLRAQFERLAPWPVRYLDPAPAIARRVASLLAERESVQGSGARPAAIFTSGAAFDAPAALAALARGEGDMTPLDAMTPAPHMK